MRGWWRVAGTLVAAVLISAVAGCDAESPQPEHGTASSGSTTPRTVLTAEDLQSARVLRAGSGYTVVADPPPRIGSRLTFFLGMISSTELFGTLGKPSTGLAGGGDVVIFDLTSGKTKRLETLGKTSQVAGMTFSDRYVVWSVSSSMDVMSGPWTIKSFDRQSGMVRTVAKASDVGGGRPSLADPEGGVPRIMGDDVIFVAGDSEELPTTATAYRVPLDGSSKPEAIAADVQGAYPSGDRVAITRAGRFSMLDPATGKETEAESQHGGDCTGFAAQGVLVTCDEVRGRPRLTVAEPGGAVTEIHLPGDNGGAATLGPAYFGASKDWVTFTYDDKAYVLDLVSKKLGRFPGAQYVSGEQSVGNTIGYSRMRTSATDVEQEHWVELELH